MRLRKVKFPLTVEAAEDMGLRVIKKNLLETKERKKAMEKEEILKALKTIKRTCEESGDCPKCPLRNPENGNECSVLSGGIPAIWKIQNEGLWTAFRQ